jgi:hypothetical protein
MNITITADGVEYIEENYRTTQATRLLQAAPR